MKVDLHCHSAVSDGLLSPAEVVRRAAANGVELLALTDHDDVSGLAEARRTAEACGIAFVDGVEASVTWHDTTIHLVGLGIDPANKALDQGLASNRRGRDARAVAMARALADIGIAGALEGAARFAKNSAIVGRTHFARYLVEQGLVRDVRTVFEHYLVCGKPGYVPHSWAGLEEAVRWIVGAGGIAVVAHPARYRLSREESHRFFGEFRDLGGRGLEVLAGAHTPEQVRKFANVARHFGFLASAASDFHGPGESHTDLGALPPLPDDLMPVWQAFPESARLANAFRPSCQSRARDRSYSGVRKPT